MPCCDLLPGQGPYGGTYVVIASLRLPKASYVQAVTSQRKSDAILTCSLHDNYPAIVPDQSPLTLINYKLNRERRIYMFSFAIDISFFPQFV